MCSVYVYRLLYTKVQNQMSQHLTDEIVLDFDFRKCLDFNRLEHSMLSTLLSTAKRWRADMLQISFFSHLK